MDIQIHASPVFLIPLREKHIEVLMLLSEHHYDGTCKAASKVGGFLYGWKNQIDWWKDYEQEEEYKTIRTNMHELGLCCKMLEMSSYLFPSPSRGLTAAVFGSHKDSEEMKVARDMRQSFNRAFSLANSKYDEWKVTSS
jgi:hypothetical protein